MTAFAQILRSKFGAIPSTEAAAPDVRPVFDSQVLIIESRVRSILAECLGLESPDGIKPDALLYDLGADSLDLLDLAIELEREFAVTFSDGEMRRLSTVGDCMKLVTAKTAKPASSCA